MSNTTYTPELSDLAKAGADLSAHASGLERLIHLLRGVRGIGDLLARASTDDMRDRDLGEAISILSGLALEALGQFEYLRPAELCGHCDGTGYAS